MTSSIVIDASFTYRLLLPGPSQATLRQLMAGWVKDSLRIYTPTLWTYEITSAISKGVRFGLFSEASGKELLRQAFQMELQIVNPDSNQANSAFQWSRRLNRANAYDCFYLGLAQSLDSELWTSDQKLVNAVNESWVRYAESANAI